MGGIDATRVSVGYVRRAHGIRGAVIIRPLTDHPTRFAAGSQFMTDEDPPRSVVIRDMREHNDGLLVRFEETPDRNAAEQLQGVTLTIGRDERRDLAENEYWPDDLQGLVAMSATGEHLGTVTGVVLGEAQDRLVVTTPEGRQVEVPFVEAMVGDVHPSLGHVTIDPPEDLF